jgi:hypothetical protein
LFKTPRRIPALIAFDSHVVTACAHLKWQEELSRMLKTLEIDLKDPKNDLTVLYNVRGFKRVSASVVPYLTFV